MTNDVMMMMMMQNKAAIHDIMMMQNTAATHDDGPRDDMLC